MDASPDSLQVETLRGFNRFYTRRIGVLEEGLLKTVEYFKRKIKE